MKKRYLLFGLLGIFLVVLIIELSCKNISKKDASLSLLEYFYGQNDSSELQLYVHSDDINVEGRPGTVTIEEYLVDSCSGIGMVKFSALKEQYSQAETPFFPRVHRADLVGEFTLQISEDQERVFGYYRFILNREAKKQDTWALSFVGENASSAPAQASGLSFVSLEYEEWIKEGEYEISLSSIGAAVLKINDGSGSVPAQMYQFDNIFLSYGECVVAYSSGGGKGDEIYYVYDFERPLDEAELQSLKMTIESILDLGGNGNEEK